MPKNKAYNRRVIVTVVIIVSVALVGLTMIKIDPADADRNLPVSVAETIPVGDQTAPLQPSLGGAITKMVSALALVILVAYFALIGLKKLMNRRYGGNGAGGGLEVIQTTCVGPHKTVSLVRVGKRSVLVGVTDQQISTLTELDVEETEAFVGQPVEPVKHDSFARMLGSASDKLRTIGLKKKQTVLET